MSALRDARLVTKFTALWAIADVTEVEVALESSTTLANTAFGEKSTKTFHAAEHKAPAG
jgi:hypothetical protein